MSSSGGTCIRGESIAPGGRESMWLDMMEMASSRLLMLCCCWGRGGGGGGNEGVKDRKGRDRGTYHVCF